MNHNWARNPDESIDNWYYEMGSHHGPYCLNCNKYFCVHCEGKILYDLQCKGSNAG